MARRLRIAVSVFFGVVAAALCTLWATSHSRLHSATFFSPPRTVQRVLLFAGHARIESIDNKFAPNLSPADDQFFSKPNFRFKSEPLDALGDNWVLGFVWERFLNGFELQFPIWIVVFGTTAAMAVLLPSWRFSLRTMLIATTLVAVVLWIACYTVR